MPKLEPNRLQTTEIRFPTNSVISVVLSVSVVQFAESQVELRIPGSRPQGREQLLVDAAEAAVGEHRHHIA